MDIGTAFRLNTDARYRLYEASGTIAAGELVQLETDGTVTKAWANDSANQALVGVAVNAAASGDHVLVVYGGSIDPAVTLTVGSTYFLLDSAAASGQLDDDVATISGAGVYIHSIGYAEAADKLIVSPRDLDVTT